MQKWISKVFAGILSAISSFSDRLDALARPRFDNDRSSLLKRVLRWPLRAVAVLLVFVGKVLWSPIQLAVTLEQGIRKSLLCLPALIVAVLVVAAIVRVHLFGGDIVNRYRDAALTAMKEQDWELAKTYLGRIVNSREDITDIDRLRWAQALEQTGSPSQASIVLDSLAPEDRPGTPLAHRLKAIAVARQVVDQTNETDTGEIERLHWHLKNAGKPDDWVLNEAWANYYLKVGQPSKATKYLQAAAEYKPEYWLAISQLFKRNGDAANERLALDEALAFYKQKVSDAPMNVRSRLVLANLLVRLKQIEPAEQVLLRGLQLKDEPLIRRSMADFYLMRHDLVLTKEPDDFEQQFKYLKRAIDLDVNYPKTYERLQWQFTSQKGKEDSQKVRGLIESMIAEGKATAWAHFTLANILWSSGDVEDAKWHMEQAYEVDERLVVVANNLAWFLANADPPELDRALKFAKDAVERSPNARFRDTLAMVLMKQGKYKEALTELEKALQTIKNKNLIHEKLAIVYEKLGKPRMAELHRKYLENVKN